MLILAFDTSSKTASVAVLRDEDILYEVMIHTGLNHSETLLPAVEQACLQTKLRMSDFDLFSCTIGPGSFTGLRIGASTLKGFMLATGKPAAGVSSLAALALNAEKSAKKIYAIMDAGRGQVYMACFRYGDNGLLEQLGGERVLNPADIEYDSDAIFVGDGAVKYAGVFTQDLGKNAIPELHQYCRAASVGRLGKEKYDRNELLDAETFVPFYLRSADADKKKSLFEN